MRSAGPFRRPERFDSTRTADWSWAVPVGRPPGLLLRTAAVPTLFGKWIPGEGLRLNLDVRALPPTGRTRTLLWTNGHLTPEIMGKPLHEANDETDPSIEALLTAFREAVRRRGGFSRDRPTAPGLLSSFEVGAGAPQSPAELIESTITAFRKARRRAKEARPVGSPLENPETGRPDKGPSPAKERRLEKCKSPKEGRSTLEESEDLPSPEELARAFRKAFSERSHASGGEEPSDGEEVAGFEEEPPEKGEYEEGEASPSDSATPGPSGLEDRSVLGDEGMRRRDSLLSILRQESRLLDYASFRIVVEAEAARIERYQRSTSSLLLVRGPELEQRPTALDERYREVAEGIARAFNSTLRSSDFLSARDDSLYLFLLTETDLEEARRAGKQLEEKVEEELPQNSTHINGLDTAAQPLQPGIDLDSHVERFLAARHTDGVNGEKP